jgi:site-specific DNA-cytosine methylase
MGAPRSYKLSPSYNESYNAMGDAVVVPVVKYLIDHLLVPLALQTRRAIPSDKKAGFQRLLL